MLYVKECSRGDDNSLKSVLVFVTQSLTLGQRFSNGQITVSGIAALVSQLKSQSESIGKNSPKKLIPVQRKIKWRNGSRGMQIHT